MQVCFVLRTNTRNKTFASGILISYWVTDLYIGGDDFYFIFIVSWHLLIFLIDLSWHLVATWQFYHWHWYLTVIFCSVLSMLWYWRYVVCCLLAVIFSRVALTIWYYVICFWRRYSVLCNIVVCWRHFVLLWTVCMYCEFPRWLVETPVLSSLTLGCGGCIDPWYFIIYCYGCCPLVLKLWCTRVLILLVLTCILPPLIRVLLHSVQRCWRHSMLSLCVSAVVFCSFVWTLYSFFSVYLQCFHFQIKYRIMFLKHCRIIEVLLYFKPPTVHK